MSLDLLIVDDSAVMRAMVLRTLQMAEVSLGEIHQAGDGREGLALLGEHSIDLAIVDINMPVMDGEEMIRRARENPATAHIPIMVISTEGSQTRISRLVQRGVRFVHKPFTPEIICDVIAELAGEAA
ncbi:MAG: response regulator [Armatimonadota bacterium]|jgi:two-component system chemotaxis response regulator CheY